MYACCMFNVQSTTSCIHKIGQNTIMQIVNKSPQKKAGETVVWIDAFRICESFDFAQNWAFWCLNLRQPLIIFTD